VTPKELCSLNSLKSSDHSALDQVTPAVRLKSTLSQLNYELFKPFRDENASFDHRLDTFDSMWLIEGAGTRFPHVLAFCGALASVFSNTATVESDFSIIVCGKCLTDLSLEGFVHCKQWQWLSIKTANDGTSDGAC
jgi:hypothetical protein